jgi:hypothetical protein
MFCVFSQVARNVSGMKFATWQHAFWHAKGVISGTFPACYEPGLRRDFGMLAARFLARSSKCRHALQHATGKVPA